MPVRQQVRQPTRFFFAGAVHEGLRMKMHQMYMQPALHHAPCGHGRIKPGAEQRDGAPRRSHRQAARPADFANVHQSTLLRDFNKHLHIGRRKVNAPTRRLSHGGAHFAPNVLRRKRVVFLGTFGTHCKCFRRGMNTRLRHRRRRQSRQRWFYFRRDADCRQTEDLLQTRQGFGHMLGAHSPHKHTPTQPFDVGRTQRA